MPESCKDRARILQRSCKILAKIMLESCEDQARFLQRSCKILAKIILESCEDHARNVRKHSKIRQDSSMILTRFMPESCMILVMILHEIFTRARAKTAHKLTHHTQSYLVYPYWEKYLLFISWYSMNIISHTQLHMVNTVWYSMNIISTKTAHKLTHNTQSYLVYPYWEKYLLFISWYSMNIISHTQLHMINTVWQT